ncbi:restriction endonuclease subunit S [Acinetobacter sp. TR11]|uniref:restriction endonuclease subunit S n=1 Tax=Acinetobacter sp. TR11 TaxID=3003393 RepID=UPI0022ABD9FD|nr:restriction endonuclease subunit S [Acinetobacter sp. TR11]WAU73758.1 restriction endonuclease subunit S [Acinetobacter sp. TR11]
MQFKQYPSYKNSGVEWLGDVPEHWNLKRFGYLFDENKKKNIGLKETNVLSLSYGNIKEKNIDDNKGLLPESFETYQIIEPNNIVFRFTDLQNDKRSLRSAISKYHGIITSAYIAVKTKQNADFYNYLFRAYDLQKVFYSMGEGMRQSLKMDELNKMPVVLPNKDEQKRIVSFLDTETARIDNLIAKQEKLIELLEEQRKSIISHAVTKGLNPNAPMKDSGVEWLGEVPEHWEVISIKFLAHCSSGQGINSLEVLDIADDKNSFPVIGGNGMMGWTSKSNYKEPVLSIGRVGALCGNVHLINYPSWISDNSLILKVYSKKVNLEILQYILLSRNLNNLASKSAQPLITGTQVKNEKITLPPPNEQSQILQYIIQNQSRINNLISKQKSLIEKLKEYRSSIISHAITGKIDVREFGA